jgi:hypothetical protein
MLRLFELSLCGEEKGSEDRKEITFEWEESVRALEILMGRGERRPTQVKVTAVVAVLEIRE